MKLTKWLGQSLLISFFITQIAFAQTQTEELRPKRTVLQKADVGNTGREVTLQIVEFPAGAAEVPHTHPGELVGYVLEGSADLMVEGKPMTSLKAGDGFIIEGGKIHAAKNTAKGSTKLLAAVILEKGKPTSAPAK
jgi:quercetin dioxygenase-like cupin family protein